MDELPEQDVITFQTEHVSFFTPTSMISLIKICKSRARKYPSEKIRFAGLIKHNYANNLGFSDALNLVGKPYPQGAFGGQSYYPLSSIRKAQLEGKCQTLGIELGDAIQIRAEEIAQVVSQRRSPELQLVLANSFREIFRNTFEHAKVSGAVFCAQFWPTKDVVEICIADRGMGVQTSLAENKYLPKFDEMEAIMASLMPGVSSKAWRAKKKRANQRSEWDNSGYGLFFAHQLFGSLGEFSIASGSAAIQIKGGRLSKKIDCKVAGTLVSMQIDLSDAGRIESEISEIRRKAVKVKEVIGTKSIDIASVEAFLSSGKLVR